jgi:SpoVK/Ycf46/Vps4 family AAA+-type ATPase
MAPAQPAFLIEIDTLIRARYSLLYLVTWEEQRVEHLLVDVAKTHGKSLAEWTATKGLRMRGTSGASNRNDDVETQSPVEALRAIARQQAPTIVLLKDFHRHLEDPLVVRALRELGMTLKSAFTTVIIIAPTLRLPEELEKEVTVIDVPLPTKDDLRELLRGIARIVTKNKRGVVELTSRQAESLVSAAHGLTLCEAENAFAKAIAQDGRLDVNDVGLILDEKSQIIRKSGLLEYVSTDESLSNVGGLARLKTWLARRGNAFSDEARQFGLPEPKGLLLLGVQGCGKSLTAKAIATSWKIPLIRLDLGRIYSGLVGSSEENLRRAIRIVESLAPVVLWIDEIEKGLAGAGGQSNDTGVSARIFGTLLTWLQEKRAPVFVVATANRLEMLPPELLRKGRFDEIFFVDLPTLHDRRDIFGIQLKRHRRTPEDFPLDELARASDNFSGAEIEQVVVAGLYNAFADGCELSPEHLRVAITETTPLATTAAEEVGRLRTWAQTRARSAS